jgi:ferrous iron transport protein A
MEHKIVKLAEMKNRSSGTVVEIKGGEQLAKRLENMGVRAGVKITKMSAQIMRGPVTLRVGNTQAAIGRGMAMKIYVKV